MTPSANLNRSRIRQVLPAIYLGRWPPGPLNSITDVAGVLAHTQSLEPDGDVHTGVTTILPRPDWYEFSSYAGVFRFNGCGEMTGTHWLNETGLLSSPIIITATPSVGEGYRGVTEYAYRNHRRLDRNEIDVFMLPVVAETYDGFLSDPARFAVTPAHVMEGIGSASKEAVSEGNTGGGTGMICHQFKGGTGSSSRIVRGFDGQRREVDYTVGVVVQANYGRAETLCIAGIPVGRILQDEGKLEPFAGQGQAMHGEEARKDGSIIVIIATDVPLLPIQLQRLAARATVGLAKVGGYGYNNSGDIFLAFSTATKIPTGRVPSDASPAVAPVVSAFTPLERETRTSDDSTLNGIFEAVADATEEAIYNAMFMARSMRGFKGRHVQAIDLDQVKRIVDSRLG